MKVLGKVSTWVQSLYDRLISSETATGMVLSTAVGIIAGLGAYAFRWLIDNFHDLFFNDLGQALGALDSYYIILIPAIGGLFVGLIIHFFAREAKGHGVPEVMAAVAAKGGRIRPRVVLAKIMASAICIGSGGSVGREGPIVQIGAAMGSAMGQRFKLPDEWLRTLVACGAAGGISATFNAPIAGVFFALEVILGRFISRSFGFVVVSSVVADVVAHALLGKEQSFLVPAYELVSAWEIPLYVLLGIIAAFVALVFVYVLYKSEDMFDAWKFPEYVKPVVGGLVVGLIGLYSLDLLGVGYGGVEKALTGNIEPTWDLVWVTLLFLGGLKIVATSITIGSGGSGGIFAPSLFMGAVFGGAFGELVNWLFPGITAPPGAYALVGMAAVFSGAARAPITSIIILFEMTRDYEIILPLMLAVVISTIVSRGVMRDSIYTAKVRRSGVDLRRHGEEDLMRTIRVSEAMTRDFPTVTLGTPVSELVTKLSRTGHHGFPVVDDEGRLAGVVTLADVEAAPTDAITDLKVEDIATTSPIVAYANQSLYEALIRVGAKDVGRIPVVDREDPTRLLGVLRRHDIIKAYRKKLSGGIRYERGY
jgi:CIC family chloride channel protein